MRIFVIGGGGREHALAWKIAQSPKVTKLLVAPGNPGIAAIADCRAVASDDLPGLLALAKAEHVDLVVVGPERPLALGLVDACAREGITCIGPSVRAAELEVSKAYAKIFMQKYQIPTAHYGIFTDAKEAKAHLRDEPLPVVIKADGLAQGKGVVVARTLKEAETTIDAFLKFDAHGEAGRRIVIEQWLLGEEVSCIALVDGEHACLFEGAQDHKTLLDGDRGPNTGGMGAYSPAPIMTAALAETVCKRIIEPTVAGLRREGRSFLGFLYAGLMVVEGKPFVLEFNVRLGDPEAQVLLMRLRSDFVDLLIASTEKGLHAVTPIWDARPSVCVVMAAPGYPGDVVKGMPITGLAAVREGPDLCVFHAGTAQRDGAIVTAGGRVLGITALGATLRDAIGKVYAAVQAVRWEGVQYRTDIGWRALRT